MTITPKDRAEEIAIFRHGIIAQLGLAELCRGELRPALQALSERHFLPPGASVSRTYSVATLQRWLRAYRAEGLDGLKPKSRKTGFALSLNPELKTLLLEIRRAYPKASAELIRQRLYSLGHQEITEVSAATLRRFFRAHGLNPASIQQATGGRARLRWEAPAPNDVWHADVCHFGRWRIHALLDDHSRLILGIAARKTETEQEMLDLFGECLHGRGAPVTLYLDNGATYRGKALQTVCARLKINLVHARPYDPQARGKMERFWRTLRQQVLAFVRPESLDEHDLNVRLWAFCEGYHQRPHGGLFGQTPAQRYRSKPGLGVDALQEAFAIRNRRKVRQDSTLSIGGVLWETDQSYLRGKNVTVVTPKLSLGRPDPRPWIEVEGKAHRLKQLDPHKNSTLRRTARQKTVHQEVAEAPLNNPLDDALMNAFKPKGQS